MRFHDKKGRPAKSLMVSGAQTSDGKPCIAILIRGPGVGGTLFVDADEIDDFKNALDQALAEAARVTT